MVEAVKAGVPPQQPLVRLICTATSNEAVTLRVEMAAEAEPGKQVYEPGAA